MEYIKRNEALRLVNTPAELDELLFDAAYYQLKNPGLNENNSALMNMAGNTLEEKLYTHWTRYGKSEGRIASPYFSAAYYRAKYTDVGSNSAEAYEHFLNYGFWEGRAGSVYCSNKEYLYGMNPDPASLCTHLQTVTATVPQATCTSNGIATTYCCECSAVLKTTKVAARDHIDADNDQICDVCQTDFGGSMALITKINTLVDPVPVNEYFDLSGVTFNNDSWDGTYYMVQLCDDGVYRILDTVNQGNNGMFPATTVTVSDGAVYGAEPAMAMTLLFYSSSSADQGTYTIRINEDTHDSCYLGVGNTTANDTDPGIGEIRRATSATAFNLRVVSETYVDRFRVARSFGKSNKTRWLELQNVDGNYCYRFTTNTLGTMNNTFYLYKLVEDRLHTESMYDTLLDAAAYVNPSAAYNKDTYEKFVSCVKTCVALYEQYNGNTLAGNDLTNKDALQDAFDAKERELIDLMAILKLNSEGKTIRYFSANMYNYNEDNMNAIITPMSGADTMGFFFESANNKTTTSAFSVYDSNTNEEVKGRTIRSQMYSIYSGLAASDLNQSTNKPFANNIVTADFWSTTPIEGAKEVYTDVGVPFIYKDGYYVLNSDENAVFFEGDPISGANLAISDRPAAYYWSGGMTHGVATQDYVSTEYLTFDPADGYVTGFQPFAKMTKREAKAYTGDASVFEATIPVDSYLIDGVAYRSQTSPVVEKSGSGTAVWGFGMKLDVKFKMTDDGYLADGSGTPITFEFSGDDDVWVYIDDKLVLDIGGSHDAIQGVINFTDGSVIVRSDKYDRVRDKNTAGYGWSDSAKYDSTQLSSVHSIINNQMYQKNLYTEVFNKSVKEFANDGQVHTLTVYYMDRGKGRTNSIIKFNLPQTDTLTVNKNVKHATYENGILNDISDDSELMQTLGQISFEYTLTDGSQAMANQTYRLLENGVKIGEFATDASGKFTLKHGQSAVFDDLNFTNAHSYKVVETLDTSTWFDIEWTYTTTGDAAVTATTPNYYSTSYNSNSSATVSISGDLYAQETITFNCTNTFVDVAPEADEVVVDYGKAMKIDVMANDPALMFINGYTRTLQGLAAYTEDPDLIESRITAGAPKLALNSGMLEIVDQQVLFTPNKMLDEVERAYCVVQYKKGTNVFYVYEELRIVPANIMYYESDFAGIVQTENERDFVFIDFGPDDTTTWTYTQNVTVEKDTENGVLKGEITGGDPFVGMRRGTHQLSYLTQPGDVIVMRLKTTRTSTGGNSKGFEVFLDFLDSTATYGWELIRNTTHEQGTGVYEVLTVALPDEMIGRPLEGFRLDPFWNADGNKVLGTYEIDYIYIGQPSTAPSDDYLFFDFDNGIDDQMRYKRDQYGGFPADTDPWSAHTTGRNTELHEGKDPGTKAFTAIYSASSYYIRTSTENASNYSLNHKPSAEDVLQVRFKVENFEYNGTQPCITVFAYGEDSVDANGDKVDDGIEVGREYLSTTLFDNDEYITVTVPFKAAYTTLDKITTFCIFFSHMSSVSETQLGEVTIDYIYVGTRDDFNKVLIYDRPVRMNSLGNKEKPAYLYFGFENTAEDQYRYMTEQYGNVNFDVGNWAHGSSKSLSIDNAEGTMTVELSKGENYNGPYVSVTNAISDYYPWSNNDTCGILTFNAKDVNVAKVRFKVENCTKVVEENATRVYLVTHFTRNGAKKYYGEAGSDAEFTIVDGEWIEVTINLSDRFMDGDILNTCGLWFYNLESENGGTITIDYIYVGNEDEYVASTMYNSDTVTVYDDTANKVTKDEAYLFIDFTNDAEDIERYALPQYGGVNFDIATPKAADGTKLPGPWSYRGETILEAIYNNPIGTMNFVAVKSQTSDKRGLYYFQSSDYLSSGCHLQYDPAEAEVIYVRMQLENFVATGTPSFYVQAFLGDDSSSPIVTLNTTATISTSHIENNEYFVVKVPATQLQQYDRIAALRFNIKNIDNTQYENGRISVDYIYVGSEEGYTKALMTHRDAWNPDDLQDDGLINNDNYLLLDFNEGDETQWAYVNGATVTKDTASGVLKGKLTGGDTYIGMKQGTNQLSYTFKKGDVVQVRLKMSIVSTNTGKAGLQLYFMNSEDNTYYEVKDNYIIHNFDEYEVVTIAIPERCWGMTACNLRIDPLSNAGGKELTGTYEIDYIYLGQRNQAPGYSGEAQSHLFFDFNNDDLSQARYRQEVYGGFSADTDPWSANTKDRNTELYEGEEEGTKAFHAVAVSNIHYVHSATDWDKNYPLNYKPKTGDVMQVRVKLENFVVQGRPYIAPTAYYGSTSDSDGDKVDDGFEMGRYYVDTAYLNAGEYFTVTIPLNAKYAALDVLKAFRLHFNEMKSVSATQLGKVTIDYIYLGPEEFLPTNDEMVIGYDSSYENDTNYSNGSSFYVEGFGVPTFDKNFALNRASYNAQTFNFTGTGFDILSRTGTQQGALRVVIYTADGTYVKTVSVVNKSEKSFELYQIPVVSVNDLPHGDYHVKIFVNSAYDFGNDGDKDIFGGALDRGNEFCFDALRIYNPIDTSASARQDNESSKMAYETYLSIGEADHGITEVRKILIDANNLNAGGSMDGVIYLDNTDKAFTIGNYSSVGPNNETYLAAGQAIAFKLVSGAIVPSSIDIGVKAVQNKPTNLTMRIASDAPSAMPVKQSYVLFSSTVQYYSLDIPASAWVTTNSGERYVYVTLANIDSIGVLSITDVKFGYDGSTSASSATRSVRFMIDEMMLRSLMQEETETAPILNENLQFNADISVGAQMQVVYTMTANTVSSYESFYLEVSKEVADGEAVTKRYDLSNLKTLCGSDGSKVLGYQATYYGIVAKEMGDCFTATLYAVTADGTVYCSQAHSASIQSYLMEKLADENTSDELKILAVDMLNYGAAAQVYFGYDLENLVNSALSEEQKQLSTQTEASAQNHQSTDGEGAVVRTDVSVGSKVVLYVTALYRSDDASALKFVIKDAATGQVLAEQTPVDLGSAYQCSYDNVGAKQMRELITVELQENGKTVSKVLTWSVESYVAGVRANSNTTAAQRNMVDALLIYGDSAARYLYSVS